MNNYASRDWAGCQEIYLIIANSILYYKYIILYYKLLLLYISKLDKTSLTEGFDRSINEACIFQFCQFLQNYELTLNLRKE